MKWLISKDAGQIQDWANLLGIQVLKKAAERKWLRSKVVTYTGWTTIAIFSFHNLFYIFSKIALIAFTIRNTLSVFFFLEDSLGIKRYRGYYMAARGYEFYLRVFNSISHEWAQRTSEISSWTREDKIRIHKRACILFIIETPMKYQENDFLD